MHQLQFAPMSEASALRSAELKDASALRQLMSDSDSVLNCGCPQFASIDWWDQRIRHALALGRMFLASDEDRILGLVTIEVGLASSSPRHADMLGQCIDRSVRPRGIGQGLCTLAIDQSEQLALDRLELYVREDKLPTLSLYESLRFQREGAHPRLVCAGVTSPRPGRCAGIDRFSRRQGLEVQPTKRIRFGDRRFGLPPGFGNPMTRVGVKLSSISQGHHWTFTVPVEIRVCHLLTLDTATTRKSNPLGKPHAHQSSTPIATSSRKQQQQQQPSRE